MLERTSHMPGSTFRIRGIPSGQPNCTVLMSSPMVFRSSRFRPLSHSLTGSLLSEDYIQSVWVRLAAAPCSKCIIISLWGKPPALPGDSQSLTFSGVGSSFRAGETRPGIQKTLDSCFRRNDGNKDSYDRLSNDCSVLILTDCDQAPSRGQQS